MTRVVLPDSPEAATFMTNIEGWVSRTGHYFGNQEDMARYDGSTHKRCATEGCKELLEKTWAYSVCYSCRSHNTWVRYSELEQVDDFEYPLTLLDDDRWFMDEDELLDYCHDHGVQPNELQLVIAKPQRFYEIEPEDYYEDILPSDDPFDSYTLPKEIKEAFDELNAKIKAYTSPASFSAGRKRPIINLVIEFEPVDIILNQKQITVRLHSLTYEQVVELAEKDPTVAYTVTFRNALWDMSGELLPGEEDEVELVDGTIFNVYQTGNA